MIECPRCGFTQPKDKYCANCGVDVENYQPKQKPFLTRLFNSPIFYLVGLGIGIALFTFFVLKQPTGTPEPLNLTPATDFKETPTRPKKVLPDAKPQVAETVAPIQIASEATEKSGSAILGKKNELEKAGTQDDTNKPEGLTKLKKPESISISFYEFSQTSINEIYKKGQVIEEGSDFQSVLFSSTSPKADLKKIDPDIESLPGSKTEVLKANSTVLFNYQLSPTESGEDLGGLSIQVLVNENSESRTSIDLAGEISLKIGEERTITTNFGGVFQLDNSHSVIFIGMLPRQAVEEKLASQVQNFPLSILTSNNFVNPDTVRPTEFLMVIQVK